MGNSWRAGFLPFLWMAIVGCLTSAGRAAFDIEAVGPAERGAATPLALISRFSSTRGPAARPAPAEPIGRRPYAASIYGFKPFGLAEIDFTAASVALPAGKSPRGVTISYERLTALSYSEQTCAVSTVLACGPAAIEPRLRVGGVVADGGFGDWAAVVDVAAGTRITASLRAAVALENPLALGLVREGGVLPQRLKIGLGILASERLGFGFEMVKEPRFPTGFRSGVEWNLVEGVFIRSGVRTSPADVSLGLGIAWGWITFDLASAYHFDLGATYEAGITLVWK